MYNAQTTKATIKSICKTKKINMEKMLMECNLGVNAIRQINDNKGMATFSLAKIADYLNCSVDYLLGRTDEPQAINQINTGNVGDNSNVNINKPLQGETDEITSEFIKVFKSLPFSDKLEVMNFAMGKVKKEDEL